MTSSRLGLPDLGIGVGLRTAHYRHLLEERPQVDFLEIISDNYMESAGRPLEVLDLLAERHPIIMHGVSLNLGGTDPLDRTYLRRLVRLRDRCKARWVSDHLCFTGFAGRNTHDLLPLPLTTAALTHIADRVRAVQDLLGAPLVVENPSTYLAWRDSTIPEAEFLAELCRRTGCGLLLDVNNIYVSARNHRFDPASYLDAVPWEHVVQFHIAGHSDNGDHIVDTHDAPVVEAVWDLLTQAWPRCGGASILLERDANIPSFTDVHAEALQARRRIPSLVAA
jgi:uncharacterized protein